MVKENQMGIQNNQRGIRTFDEHKKDNPIPYKKQIMYSNKH